MYSKLYQQFYNFKHGTEYLNYGREIIVDFAKRYCSAEGTIRVLDIGGGAGTDLCNIREGFAPRKVELYELEAYPPNCRKAEERGISVKTIDVEREKFPYDNQYFDVVVANQVYEHLKEIIWVTSEISRILKPQGILIIGVPNLASLHNRVLLLMGRQPSSIYALGPHVRGYTPNDLENFFETDGYFSCKERRGANFYPFPPKMARWLSEHFPDAAVSTFYCVERTEKEGFFKDVLKDRFFETPYYVG